MKSEKHKLICLASTLILAGDCLVVMAQRPERLTSQIDGRNRVILRGSRNPRIESLPSDGPVEDTMRISGLTFRFQPSAEQTAELEHLLEQQQNPASPLYHSWLTPEEYGERFGITPNELGRVSDWLTAEGFHIDSTARSRTWIMFSGTAAQVRTSFRTDLHHFRVNDELHYANVREAEIPAVMEPLIYNLQGLDDFRMERHSRIRQATTRDGEHVVGPGDLAVIYNLTPLHEKGITGAGQKIVIAGESAFNMSDIQDFRSRFGLPKGDPEVVLMPDVKDPRINDNVLEALLGLEYAGGAAPDAKLIYVYGQTAYRAVTYSVDQNLAPVIVYSFGGCEKSNTAPGTRAAVRNLAQQAAAQGITWVVSSGDTGPAACEYQGTDALGMSGMYVNLPASVPEVTAVGGTEFDGETGNYWSQLNDTINLASALSYIPEKGWNDLGPGKNLSASGGGVSILYPRPAWQTGPGIPNDDARHVPDIAFTASWDHDAYLVAKDGGLFKGGGTSVAAPFFAGVLALLNQHVVDTGIQSKSGLGNVNPRLYELARTTSDVFHDITTGNNIIPCKTGTQDCTNGQYGYTAGPGYDHVTGLGSIDAANLIKNWATSKSTPEPISTALTVTANPASFPVTGSTSLTVTVKAASGTVPPAGSVELKAGNTSLGSVSLLGSGASATASARITGSMLAEGPQTIIASYPGTTTFGPSSGSANVTVNATATSTVDASVIPSPVYQITPDADGYAWYFTVRVAETGGAPTTFTSMTLDGEDLSANIKTWFGTTTLAANREASVRLRSKDLTVPIDRVFTFGGVDTDGGVWSRRLTVRFMGTEGSAHP